MARASSGLSVSSSRSPSPANSSRPKAKVNSSALRRTPSVTRPSSPTKPTTPRRDRALSPPPSTLSIGTHLKPVARVKSYSTVKTTKSSSPELRFSTLTASSHVLLRPDPAAHSRKPSPVLQPSRITHSELGHAVNHAASQPPLKIRSKVTAMARNTSNHTPAFPPALSPTTSTSSTGRPHVRAGPVPSTAPSPAASPPTSSAPAYPITTAVPAANPHRYATPRSSLSGLRSSFSSPNDNLPAGGTDDFRPFSRTSVFPSSLNNGLRGSSYGSLGRAALSSVDPTNIPPLPQSPPVSVSSRRSSNFTHDSGTSPESSVVSGGSSEFQKIKKKKDSNSSPDLRATLDHLIVYASSSREDDSPVNGSLGPGSTVEEDEEKAEAKSNRKMADLEITNRSLLAINISLEKTKSRQSKEIHQLRRQLRETRLLLPPMAYCAVKSSLDPSEIGDDEREEEDGVDSDVDFDNVQFHSADEGVHGASTRHEKDTDNNAAYKRIKLIIENLLETGKKALEKTKEDFIDTRGGAKVLTAEEVESWRDSGARSSTIGRFSDSESHLENEDASRSYSGCLTLSHSPTPLLTLNNESVIRSGPRQPNLGLSSSSTMKLLSSPKPPPILVTETPYIT